MERVVIHWISLVALAAAALLLLAMFGPGRSLVEGFAAYCGSNAILVAFGYLSPPPSPVRGWTHPAAFLLFSAGYIHSWWTTRRPARRKQDDDLDWLLSFLIASWGLSVGIVSMASRYNAYQNYYLQ